ncbi:DUF502 domain-containing protein [Pontibacter sp. JAM-7]|uniref:DUF502 domain-containing protein n=1 Tax=Pontibacter sp. JAM-7 TaxID=3366581 RepID=UPI003AF9712F
MKNPLLFRSLIRFFFQGLLILLPAVLTVYLVYLIFAALNNTVFSAIGSVIQVFFPAISPGAETVLLGGLCTLALIILTGAIASNYLGAIVLSWLDRLLEKTPVVKLLYNTLKDLFKAFLGDQKSFEAPVLVTLTPDGAIKAMGFITNDQLDEFGLAQDVAVYLPQSYNFAGNLIIVPKDRITRLDAKASRVTTFVVSGGITSASKGEGSALKETTE